MLAGKGIVRAGYENKKGNEIGEVVVEVKWIFSAAQTLRYRRFIRMKLDSMEFISEIICLKKIKDGAYLINLDEYADVGTHLIALFCRKTEIAYCDGFSVEHVTEEIRGFIANKNIKSNIFRVQARNSIMCGFFCIGFINFMLASKKLTYFTNLLSPYDFEKNGSIISE